MEVVVGTYEELILGYKLKVADKKYTFENSFTDHSHTGSVKTVAISPTGVLASGSSDESIKLFNLKRRKETGSLLHHEGSITGLCFYGKSHLFSTSEDGTIGVWQVGKWECLRTLKGHRGPVHHVSIHPSGKMALSVSQDKSFRIWNLITGKCAYIKALKEVADLVVWSQDGAHYVIVSNSKADTYDVDTAEVTSSVQFPGRIQALNFLKDNTLILGGDGGKVVLHDIEKQKKLLELSTNTIRVKDLAFCQCPSDDSSIWLCTASSDGFIKMWSLSCNKEGCWSYEPLGEVDTKFRLLSIAMLQPQIQEKADGGHLAPASHPQLEEAEADAAEESEEESEMKQEQEDASSEDTEEETDEEERQEEVQRPLTKKRKMKGERSVQSQGKEKQLLPSVSSGGKETKRRKRNSPLQQKMRQKRKQRHKKTTGNR